MLCLNTRPGTTALHVQELFLLRAHHLLLSGSERTNFPLTAKYTSKYQPWLFEAVHGNCLEWTLPPAIIPRHPTLNEGCLSTGHFFMSWDYGTSLPNSNISPLLQPTGKVTAFNGFWSYYFCEEGNVHIMTFLFLYIKKCWNTTAVKPCIVPWQVSFWLSNRLEEGDDAQL